MKSYLISYDLDSPGQNYEQLYNAIKRLGNYWHCLDSVWIVKTNDNASNIRDILKKHIDSNDKILVVHLSGEGARTGFSKESGDWLENNL